MFSTQHLQHLLSPSAKEELLTAGPGSQISGSRTADFGNGSVNGGTFPSAETAFGVVCLRVTPFWPIESCDTFRRHQACILFPMFFLCFSKKRGGTTNRSISHMDHMDLSKGLEVKVNHQGVIV